MPTNLINEISKSISKNKVLKLSELLRKRDFDTNQLIDLTFHNDKGIAFRAAWLLENLILNYQEASIPYFPYLLSRLKDVTNHSCMRHYAKIVMHLTSPRAAQPVRAALQQLDLEPTVAQCFDWIIDPQVMVAVKSSACEALFNMRLRYPWIADELPAQLEHLMRDGSAAIQTKGRRLLSFLKPD
jgi:hypothetical protein